MLRQLSEIKNFALAATGGEIGRTKQLFFDDEIWTVRYLVVETGGRPDGRSGLIGPAAPGAIDASSTSHRSRGLHSRRGPDSNRKADWGDRKEILKTFH